MKHFPIIQIPMGCGAAAACVMQRLSVCLAATPMVSTLVVAFYRCLLLFFAAPSTSQRHTSFSLALLLRAPWRSRQRVSTCAIQR
jgi:predicted naringenin-chalcone synthase